jgi:hypothetical protein
MTPNESAANVLGHNYIGNDSRISCCECGWNCDGKLGTPNCWQQHAAHIASLAAQPLVPATEGPLTVEDLRSAMESSIEHNGLACGECGDEGFTLNEAEMVKHLNGRLRAALAESQQQAAPLPTQSRSVQKRIAAQKGEPAPTFAAVAPATEGKLREYAEHRLFEANILVGKIQKIVREALPGERWSEWDVLDQGVLQALAQVRREALEEAAKVIDDSIGCYDDDEGAQRIALRLSQAAIRALTAQPTPAPKGQP